MKKIHKNTIDTILKNINECIKSGLSKTAYCESKQIYSNYFSVNINKIIEGFKIGIVSKKDFNKIIEAASKLDSKYSQYKELSNFNPTLFKTPENLEFKEEVETDDVAEISYNRDKDGKIQYYVYNIFRKNKPAISGKFTRNEMNDIYHLYSYYGNSLTQREISRKFPELSLIDLRRILRAFNITKASSPFAPHMFEEYTEEELRMIQLREKEYDLLRKVEEDEVKNNKKLLIKYAQENLELKNTIYKMSNLDFSFLAEQIKPTYIETKIESKKDLILHLSDLHIGAKVEYGSLYKNDWDEVEAKRRLKVVLEKIGTFGPYDTIIINLLGDNLDGIDQQTARGGNILPQNMDNMEQVQNYIGLMEWFISSIYQSKICNHLQLFGVRSGNHDGITGYVSTMALFYKIQVMYPEIKTCLFDEFFGYFKLRSHTFIITHGKDDKFMKHGLPLNLDNKSKIMLYEWLDSQGITGDYIHIIKGDLHSENINSCNKLDYRNVLSLFGASDYSNYNFSRNQYGVSYELLINDNLVRGTFENM